MHSLVAIVFCILVVTVEGSVPSLTNSTVKIKDLSLLGAELTLATYTFTFDSDLYLHKSNYCPAYDCIADTVPHVDQLNCVCDYTDQYTCGSGYLYNNNVTSCGCSLSICDANVYNWTDIVLTLGGSQKFRSVLEAGESGHWRLFVDSCKGFRAYVTTFVGTSTIFISNEGPATAQNSNWKKTNAYEKEEIFVCPTDSHFIEGTYFIAVSATTHTEFDLTVEELIVAQPNNTYMQENCEQEVLLYYPWMTDFVCLMDGVPAFNNNVINDFAAQIPPYFFNVTFNNGTCTPIFVAIQEYTAGATTTVAISIPSEFSEAKWTTSNRESFILCPISNEPWKMIQLTVTSTSFLWDYRLVLSTSYFENHWTHTRLSDIPVWEVNFELGGTATVNTDPYPVDAMMLWNGDGYEATPQYVLKCTDWKVDCKTLSFTTTENPLFPVPPIVLNLPGVGDLFRSVTGNYSIPVPLPDPRSYSAVVLLSYKTNAYVLNIPNSGVEEISVEFHGKIGSLSGETIRANFTATKIEYPCHYSEYQQTLSEIQKTLDELSDALTASEISTIRYKLDSEAYRDSFSFCRQFVDGLTIGATSQNFTIQSFYCPYDSGTPEWYNDPCCNQAAVWLATCFPRNATGPLPQFKVQEDAVKKVCKNVKCSESYLDDYSSAKSAFESGQCSVDLNKQKLRKEEIQKQYLQCKENAFPFLGQSCLVNSDCFYPHNNITYPCSMTSRTCVVPYGVMEVPFVDCLRSFLTEGQEVYLTSKYNFTAERDVPLFTDLWLASVTTIDCVSLYGNAINLEHRHRISTVPLNLECAEAYACESYQCEDSSCPYPDRTCHYTCGMAKSVEVSSEAQCKSESICNWDSALCEGQSLVNCASLCQTPGTHFCGFCDSFGDCTEFFEISNPSICDSTSVCLLPNGTYLFNISEAQCESYAECDLPYCGLSCVTNITAYEPGICYSYENNSADCTSKGGTWTVQPPGPFSPEPYICIYEGVTTNTSCATFENSTWDSCPEIPFLYQCAVSSYFYGPFKQNIMGCRLQGNPCLDSNTCTESGLCTDREFLLDLEAEFQRFGGCVVQRSPSTDVSSFPSCPAEMIAVPKGCMYPSDVSDALTCYDLSTVTVLPTDWQFPAQDEETCGEPKGCLEVVGDQQRFSLKDEENCTSQYTGDEWSDIWQWKPGRWTGGSLRSLSWTSRQAYPKYNWTSTINFIQIQEDFYGSAVQDLAFSSKSASLCQYQRTLVPMEAVTCDCTDSGSSNCFETDPVSAIAQAQVCSETSDTQFYSGIRLSFYSDTVTLSCADILISKISVRTFQSQPEQRLLANFIPLTKKEIPQYAIFNDHGVVVGNVLADGVTLTPLAESAFSSFELCIQLQAEQKQFHVSKDYPVLDFATTDENKEDVIPLRMQVYQTKVLQNSVYDGIYLCSVISNLTAEYSYFPIERKSDYENTETEFLSPTAEILTYTLAAMFLLIAAVSTGQIAFYVYSWMFKNLPIVLEHFLILFIWLFVSVRTVYFFLVAAGFETALADYALVALPTFFYFTAFSIIIVLWAVVASKRFTSDVTAFTKTINLILIIVNALLYAIFVALVLGFQLSKSTSASPCSGRQEDEDNSSELKRNISIAYGLIIAAISFVIGVLFVVFGLRLRTFIADSQSNSKIFVVTAICSVCFILHSIFIVVVSFLETPNLYFSFCGLAITEWFPAIFIISWLFVQRASSMSNSASKDKTSGPKSLPRSVSRTTSKTEDSRSQLHSAVELHQFDVQ